MIGPEPVPSREGTGPLIYSKMWEGLPNQVGGQREGSYLVEVTKTCSNRPLHSMENRMQAVIFSFFSHVAATRPSSFSCRLIYLVSPLSSHKFTPHNLRKLAHIYQQLLLQQITIERLFHYRLECWRKMKINFDKELNKIHDALRLKKD